MRYVNTIKNTLNNIWADIKDTSRFLSSERYGWAAVLGWLCAILGALEVVALSEGWHRVWWIFIAILGVANLILDLSLAYTNAKLEKRLLELAELDSNDVE